MSCIKCEWWKPYKKEKAKKTCAACVLKGTPSCMKDACPYLGACALMQNERLIKDEKTKKLWESCTG